MKSKISILLTICLLCLGSNIQAQKYTIEGIRKISKRNSGAIFSNNVVKGYYSFYESDKVSRKTREYTLVILDENLNQVKELSFQDSKDLYLMEVSFNGTHLIFQYYESKENFLEYRTYDATGKMTMSYQHELSKKAARYFEMVLGQDNDNTESQSLFPIENKGFLSCIPIKDNGDFTFEVSFYNTTKKGEWNFVPESENKYDQPQYLGSNDSIAVFQITSKKSALGGKYENSILGLDLQKGKAAFQLKTDEVDEYSFIPMNLATIPGKPGFVLTGSYFGHADNPTKDKSLGLAIWVMNNKGKLISSKYDGWASEIGKFIPVNARGKIEDFGYMYVHKIIATKDNKIFAIGEGYKKVASALGIATKILSRGQAGSTTKLKITDMMLLEFDTDFNLKNATIYEKAANGVEMPDNYDFVGPQRMAYLAKIYGFFDFQYSQVASDLSTFSVGYFDYVKEEGYKGYTFNSLTYNNDKISQDKINLKSEATLSWINVGKTGSVLVQEYYRKEKKVEMRLEKMN